MILLLPYFSFFLLFSFVGSYNLAIDVNPQAIRRFLNNFGSFYTQQLTNYEIHLIEKDRRLGKIALASTTVSEVNIENVETIKKDGDYHMKITHLHARLHGEYKHNVLFVHQQGDFDLRIRDLNATIGPLVPVTIAGIPFIDINVGCSISHAEDDFDVHGGILKVIAKRRLRETLETDLENLLCESFIEILDKGIRISLDSLQLKTVLKDGEVMSFTLSRPPMILESGAVRFFHEGITSLTTKKNIFTIENFETNDFDVILYIHQDILTEALMVVCKDFKKEVAGREISCINVSASFSELSKSQTVLLSADFVENGERKTRTFIARLLHSDKLVLFLRLKSELLEPGTRSDDFSRTLFTSLSDDLRNNFQIALPIPKHLRMENMQALFRSDQLILVGNLK